MAEAQLLQEHQKLIKAEEGVAQVPIFPCCILIHCEATKKVEELESQLEKMKERTRTSLKAFQDQQVFLSKVFTLSVCFVYSHSHV